MLDALITKIGLGELPAIYAVADVCRPDLLVEIEGIAFSWRGQVEPHHNPKRERGKRGGTPVPSLTLRVTILRERLAG